VCISTTAGSKACSTTETATPSTASCTMLWQQPRDSGHDCSCAASRCSKRGSWGSLFLAVEVAKMEGIRTIGSGRERNRGWQAMGAGHRLALERIAERCVDTYILHIASRRQQFISSILELQQQARTNIPQKRVKMKRHPHQSNQNRMILQQTPSHVSRETLEGAPKYAAYCTKVIVPRRTRHTRSSHRLP
jgi:hypothetical protein